ncbi:MAG TPA: hypothetical protein VEU06_05125 [Micropepsaceae bacterium]|nr:hypothetical protein [Micropepsaceae bacterium]
MDTGRNILRLIAISLVAAAVLGSTAAFAAWKEYPYKELGFVVEFPDPPQASNGNYRTVLVDSAPVHIYSQHQEGALFVASVVDLQSRAEDGASLMTEAEFNLGLLGDISGTSVSRVEPGKAAVFGRFITIDCKSGKVPDQPGQTEAAHSWYQAISGTQCPDGGRLTVNMFFHRGRLYLVQGINLPSTEDNNFGPAALRFANSISFFAPDGSRNRADGNGG